MTALMNQGNYPVVKKSVPTFYFIGVTTTKSSIMKVFPLWMKLLGREEVVMEGVDCKIHDDPRSIGERLRKSNMTPFH